MNRNFLAVSVFLLTVAFSCAPARIAVTAGKEFDVRVVEDLYDRWRVDSVKGPCRYEYSEYELDEDADVLTAPPKYRVFTFVPLSSGKISVLLSRSDSVIYRFFKSVNGEGE